MRSLFCFLILFVEFASFSQRLENIYLAPPLSASSSEIFEAYVETYPISSLDSAFHYHRTVLKGHHPYLQLQHQLAYALFLAEYNREDSALSVVMSVQQSPYLESKPQIAASAHTLRGNIYYSLDRAKDSREAYTQALNIFGTLMDSSGVKASYINIGNTFFKEENMDSAYYYFSMAKRLELLGVTEFRLNLTNNLATVYLNLDSVDLAIELYRDLLNRYEDAPLVYYTNLGNAYRRAGMDDSAQYIILHGLSLTNDSTDSFEGRFEAFLIMSQLYEADLEFDSAFFYSKLADSLRTLERVVEKNQRIDELTLVHQQTIYEKEQVIALQQLQAQTLIRKLYLIGLVSMVFVLVLVFYSLKKQRRKNELLAKQLIELTKSRMSTKKGNAVLEKEAADDLIRLVKQDLITNKGFRDQDLTIEKLAKKLKTNRTYLSDTIGQYYEGGFRSLINKLRIEEACEMMMNQQFDHYSIEGISQTVGFKSLSTFNSAFKNITGLTPSYFRKSAALTEKVAFTPDGLINSQMVE